MESAPPETPSMTLSPYCNILFLFINVLYTFHLLRVVIAGAAYPLPRIVILVIGVTVDPVSVLVVQAGQAAGRLLAVAEDTLVDETVPMLLQGSAYSNQMSDHPLPRVHRRTSPKAYRLDELHKSQKGCVRPEQPATRPRKEKQARQKLPAQSSKIPSSSSLFY